LRGTAFGENASRPHALEAGMFPAPAFVTNTAIPPATYTIKASNFAASTTATVSIAVIGASAGAPDANRKWSDYELKRSVRSAEQQLKRALSHCCHAAIDNDTRPQSTVAGHSCNSSLDSAM
jgi:hypothetical protein